MVENMATIVDWYGPFGGQGTTAISAASAAAKKDFGPGLYIAVGHSQRVRRGPVTLLYAGISADLATRVTPGHETLSKLSISTLWLGEIGTAGIPGRRAKRTDPHLDTVEWMTAYFLRVPYNDRKRVNPPPLSAVVLNRWWKPDYETPVERPVARWADVIEWNAINRTANLCWFGKRPKVVPLDDRGERIRRAAE